MFLRYILKSSIIAALLIAFQVSAQDQTCRLNGIVLDAESNNPIPDVEIKIEEVNLYTTTNKNGEFFFERIKSGVYTIELSHVSYKESVIEVKPLEKGKKYFALYLEPRNIELGTVVVTDHHTHSKLEEFSELTGTLKGKELEKDLSITLASTLKHETGLAVRSMGPAPSRPVIRGLGGDRVVISEDNNKTTDLSSTSPDHAVTVEPFSVNKIEVIRGPKVLTRTSTTIGGIVNIVRHEIPVRTHKKTYVTLGAYGESVNSGKLGSVTAEVPLNPVFFRFDYSLRDAGNLETPNFTLGNTATTNHSGSFGGSYIFERGYVGASVREFKLEYGVPGGFIGGHAEGADIELFKRQINIKSKYDFNSAGSSFLEAQISRTYYRHKEFEKALNKIGTEFKIENYQGTLDFNYSDLLLFNKGVAGVSFETRDFEIGGRVLTPPSKSYNISGYLFEAKYGDDYSVELGARYSYDVIDPLRKDPNSKIGNVRKRTFSNYSISASGIYEVSGIVHVGLNLSRSSRVPTIEELFSGGPHLAAFSYETGNPDLDAESGFGSEVFIYHRFEDFFFNFNFFRNQLSSYIIPRNTGTMNYTLLLPVYATEGVNALLYGFEYEFTYNLTKSLTVETSGSYTVGEFVDTGNPLPQIPPYKGLLSVKYSTKNLSLFANSEFASAQNSVDIPEDDGNDQNPGELPTAGYVVFNAGVQYSFEYWQTLHNFSLSVDNLSNVEYRNHLSRIKQIAPEAGRNFRLTYKIFFSF